MTCVVWQFSEAICLQVSDLAVTYDRKRNRRYVIASHDRLNGLVHLQAFNFAHGNGGRRRLRRKMRSRRKAKAESRQFPEKGARLDSSRH
jgi:hypothetical protein